MIVKFNSLVCLVNNYIIIMLIICCIIRNECLSNTYISVLFCNVMYSNKIMIVLVAQTQHVFIHKNTIYFLIINTFYTCHVNESHTLNPTKRD